MSLVNESKPAGSTSVLRRFGMYAGVLLVVFLLGLIPMWLKAQSAANRLDAAEHQLTLVRMQNNLSSATIDARRGDYEPARLAASQFFTSLRAEEDKGDASTLTRTQRDGAQSLFSLRDEIITLLARSDPASADRLSDLYVAYRKVVNERGGS
ncbi:MAG TPA: hypothetical protein VGB73_13435 [Pyrinomonadaceae bacterium]|jgi:hypothetical protein